jgi:hypothetical protein
MATDKVHVNTQHGNQQSTCYHSAWQPAKYMLSLSMATSKVHVITQHGNRQSTLSLSMATGKVRYHSAWQPLDDSLTINEVYGGNVTIIL